MSELPSGVRKPRCTARQGQQGAPELCHQLFYVVRERTQHLQAAVRDEPQLSVDDRTVAAADEKLAVARAAHCAREQRWKAGEPVLVVLGCNQHRSQGDGVQRGTLLASGKLLQQRQRAVCGRETSQLGERRRCPCADGRTSGPPLKVTPPLLARRAPTSSASASYFVSADSARSAQMLMSKAEQRATVRSSDRSSGNSASRGCGRCIAQGRGRRK